MKALSHLGKLIALALSLAFVMVGTSFSLIQKISAVSQQPAELSHALFEITQYSLQKMKSAGIPDDTREKLATLENQVFIGLDEFLEAAKKAIGDALTVKYGSTIREFSILPHPPHLAMSSPPLFEITPSGLDQLKAVGIPASVITRLSTLQGQEIIGARNFLDYVRKAIGAEQTNRYQSRILGFSLLPRPVVYDITQNGLTQMQKAGVPADVTGKLAVLQNKVFTGPAFFLEAVEKTIGEGDATKYKTQIVQNSTVYALGHPYPQTRLPASAFNKALEITQEGLAQMQKAGIPADVTSKLTTLQGQVFVQQTAFIDALNNTIGASQTTQYQAIIIGYSTVSARRSIFQITPEGLSQMQKAGVPAEVTVRLGALQGQVFVGEDKFLDALTKTIGEAQTARYGPVITRISFVYPLTIATGPSDFPEPIDPETGKPISAFMKPPGTNLLPSVFTNAFDGLGNQMENTLPSTPTTPYNLHDGDPAVSRINQISPTDDLRSIFEVVKRLASKPEKEMEEADVDGIRSALQLGVDIMEGYPVPERAYSGLPLLHYTGPEKVRKVVPIRDGKGNTIGGNVDIHQVWYDSHIESDVSYVDPTEVEGVPWTMTYTVDVLNRGGDDFSPFVMYVDPSAGMPAPHVAMDQSFFPMDDGTRTVFKIKMAPGKYFNLTYNWGWRMHPPRAQVIENATKKASINGETPKTLVQWEQSVFCPDPAKPCTRIRCGHDEPRYDGNGRPTPCQQTVIDIIETRIGDLAPEKQIWKGLRHAREAAYRNDYNQVLRSVEEAQEAFFNWTDRTSLPTGFFLFTTPSNETFVRQLNDRKFPDGLRQEFAGHNVSLSNSLAVTVNEPGAEWLVKDDTDIWVYTIKLKQEQSREKILDIHRGIEVDKTTNLTMLYVNNTIYAEFSEISNNIADSVRIEFPQWQLRGTAFRSTIYNGDYFVHGYQNVDFGGARGWENQFKSSVKVGGSGCWFTFGRVHWWMNIPNDPPSTPNNPSGDLAVTIPPATVAPYKPSRQRLQLTYNYEPSRRLRLYQFDPLHHDVAIMSLH